MVFKQQGIKLIVLLHFFSLHLLLIHPSFRNVSRKGNRRLLLIFGGTSYTKV